MAGTMRTRDLNSFQKATMEQLERKHVQNRTIRNVKKSKLSIAEMSNNKSKEGAAKQAAPSPFFKQPPKITVRKEAIQMSAQNEDDIPLG